MERCGMCKNNQCEYGRCEFLVALESLQVIKEDYWV